MASGVACTLLKIVYLVNELTFLAVDLVTGQTFLAVDLIIEETFLDVELLSQVGLLVDQVNEPTFIVAVDL